MPNRDMRQITYLRDSSSLRGVGPLQLCQAAISVSVEAQEFAANFDADGGTTNAPVIRSADELDDDPDAETTEADQPCSRWSIAT